MVAVAMATYNGERYIREQLDSIVGQTIIPDQIVVCDDGSSDNTVDILLEYKKSNANIRWSIIINDQNLGYVKNFAKAISLCDEEIIILSDQDDIWKSNKVERTIDFFKDPRVLSLHGDIDIVDKNNIIIKKNAIGYERKKDNMKIDNFFRHIYYCGMSSAFRKEIQKDILKIDIDKVPSHDWMIHAIAVCKGGFYTSSEILVSRRFHEDNVALNLSKTERKGIEQRIDVINYYCRHYDLLLDYYEKFGKSKKELALIKKICKTNKKRLDNISNRNRFKAIANIKNIKYYPTKKAYISDAMYLFGVF